MKYELTDEKMTTDDGVTLHRIRATKPFRDVKPGDLGGWVETEANLSHEGISWVLDNARVYGDARVLDNARLTRLIAAVRSDGYPFALLPMADGSVRVSAGCRLFSFEEAREHWTRTRGGTPLGDETMRVLDYLALSSAIGSR